MKSTINVLRESMNTLSNYKSEETVISENLTNTANMICESMDALDEYSQSLVESCFTEEMALLESEGLSSINELSLYESALMFEADGTAGFFKKVKTLVVKIFKAIVNGIKRFLGIFKATGARVDNTLDRVLSELKELNSMDLSGSVPKEEKLKLEYQKPAEDNYKIYEETGPANFIHRFTSGVFWHNKLVMERKSSLTVNYWDGEPGAIGPISYIMNFIKPYAQEVMYFAKITNAPKDDWLLSAAEQIARLSYHTKDFEDLRINQRVKKFNERFENSEIVKYFKNKDFSLELGKCTYDELKSYHKTIVKSIEKIRSTEKSKKDSFNVVTEYINKHTEALNNAINVTEEWMKSPDRERRDEDKEKYDAKHFNFNHYREVLQDISVAVTKVHTLLWKPWIEQSTKMLTVTIGADLKQIAKMKKDIKTLNSKYTL